MVDGQHHGDRPSSSCPAITLADRRAGLAGLKDTDAAVTGPGEERSGRGPTSVVGHSSPHLP